MELTVVLILDDHGGFTAMNPETGSTTQGDTVANALEHLLEATELYLEEFPVKTVDKALLTKVHPKSKSFWIWHCFFESNTATFSINFRDISDDQLVA